MEVHRGEVFYADLSPVVGSEQGGVRPVLIVQNEIGNRHSPTVIAAAITSRLDKARLPTHINIRAADTGLAKDSVVLLEQIRTLDKHRLRERAGQITPEDQKRVEQGGVRPVLIVQNEIGNRHSPTVIAAAITSRLDKARLPTHINIRAADTGLAKDSVVLLEQIRTLDKHRLRERAGQITPEDQKRVDQALDVSLGLTSY